MAVNVKSNWENTVFQSLFQFNDKGQLILLNYHIENDTTKDNLESIKILKEIISHLEKTNGFIFYRLGCNKERFSNMKFSNIKYWAMTKFKPGCVFKIPYILKFDKEFANITCIHLMDIEEV